MKIIDRYLLRAFLGPLAICLAAFIMLFIVADLFDNLSTFIGGRTAPARIVLYYLARIPTGLPHIAPASLLLALLYCLSHLTKNNELTALRACGVSTGRLMRPFLAVGVFSTIVVAGVNEGVSPWATWWTKQFVAAQSAEDPETAYVALRRAYRNNVGRRTWVIERFDTRTQEMQGVEVTQNAPGGGERYKFTADRARWLDGRWWLFGRICRQEFDPETQRLRQDILPSPREMAEWDETPRLFLEEIYEKEFRSVAGLFNYLRNNPDISPGEVKQVRVDIHSRLAFPFAGLIMTLIGLPFGYHTGRKGALAGVLSALGLFFGFFILTHFGVWLGKNTALPAWIAGWLPNIAFLGLSVGLLIRQR